MLQKHFPAHILDQNFIPRTSLMSQQTRRQEAVTPTITVGHAVEEEPGGICVAVLDEGHVVTGFDAEHGEQLHPLAGEAALPPRAILQLLGDGQLAVPMGFSPRVEVNLNQCEQVHTITLTVTVAY